MKTTLLLIFLALLFLSSMSWGQDGFSMPVAPDLSLAPGGVAQKNFPAVQTSVRATEILKADSFNFIAGILANGRRSPDLDCEVRLREIKEERKFSTGTELVEALEIALTTDHMGPRTIKFSFPMGSRLGRRVVNNQDHGPVEEIKIESPEPYENWFQFQHDGQRLVWAEIGSMYQFAPCLLKRR